jgi:23S rRNA (cytosine1962-C5)-methyltransferase
MQYPSVKLSKNGIKKYLSGHLWFTKDDIKDFHSLKEKIAPGELVKVFSQEGYFLGIGYFNPLVYYCLKLLTKEEIEINQAFFEEKFRILYKFKKRLYPDDEALRLVFAEGDFLPGLIIDLYKDIAVVQTYTTGMEKLLSTILNALRGALSFVKGVVIKNDSPKRKEEGLSLYVKVEGEVKELVEVKMGGLKWLIPVIKGQKTGSFLDQRENRRFIKRVSKDLCVIDAFSYIGGFSFYALSGGAKRAFLVDRSSMALSIAEEIAKINGFKDKVILIEADVFHFLKNPPSAEVLILDPPAFIKSRKDLKQGERKYTTLYNLGTRALKEGFLMACSCSHFLEEEKFQTLLLKAIKKEQKQARILYKGIQAPDHPVNPGVKETSYLKALCLYLE